MEVWTVSQRNHSPSQERLPFPAIYLFRLLSATTSFTNPAKKPFQSNPNGGTLDTNPLFSAIFLSNISTFGVSFENTTLSARALSPLIHPFFCTDTCVTVPLQVEYRKSRNWCEMSYLKATLNWRFPSVHHSKTNGMIVECNQQPK